MKLQLVQKYTEFRDSGLYLYIFPEAAYWFSSSQQCTTLFDQLQKGITLDSLNKKADTEIEELLQDLIDVGIVSIDGIIVDNREVISPRGSVRPVRDVCEFELTLQCNLRCQHCYISAGEVTSTELDIDAIARVITDLNIIYAGLQSTRRVVLTGGEPFLRKDLIEIVRLISKSGFQILINTNGLLVSQDHLEQLKIIPGLQICISLDGLKENHEAIRGKNTYERTIDKIKEIQKSGIIATINCLMHKDNYQDLPSMFQLAKDLNLYGINPVPLVLMGRANSNHLRPVPEKIFYRFMFDIMKNDPEVEKLIRRTSFLNFVAGLGLNVKCLYCGTGSRGTHFVACDGNVYPCPNMRYNQFKLGNILKNSLKDILDNNTIIAELQNLSVDSMNNKCKQCDVKYYCGGYCRGETFGITGDINSPYIRCEEYKQGVIECFWLLSRNPDFFQKRISEFHEEARAADQSEPILDLPTLDVGNI